jgi:homoserine dehydrogenase
MKNFNIAILGCGTVGSGVAKILLDQKAALGERSRHSIELKTIVDLIPSKSAERYGLPLGLFSGGGRDLSREEAATFTADVIKNEEIDCVVETIGGTSEYLLRVMLGVIRAKKHLVTANKAMLAVHGEKLFAAAKENGVTLGYEASVCGAIPIIKAIRESFTGDEVQQISGIMNGTSNYILSHMANDGLDFPTALKLAQEAGYAEADPTLDISGGDAAHKLVILMQLAFGAHVDDANVQKIGIQTITKEDIDFAAEMDCSIKLICHAKKSGGKVFASALPMMVHRDNLLSKVDGAVNCVEVRNLYSGKHYLVGAGAGSLETASSIVGDIVFAARYGASIDNITASSGLELADADTIEFPYIVTFSTEDRPGVTGSITMALGREQISIDSVSQNRRGVKNAVFSIVTMPCTLRQINKAIDGLKNESPGLFSEEPRLIPILR